MHAEGRLLERPLFLFQLQGAEVACARVVSEKPTQRFLFQTTLDCRAVVTPSAMTSLPKVMSAGVPPLGRSPWAMMGRPPRQSKFPPAGKVTEGCSPPGPGSLPNPAYPVVGRFAKLYEGQSPWVGSRVAIGNPSSAVLSRTSCLLRHRRSAPRPSCSSIEQAHLGRSTGHVAPA